MADMQESAVLAALQDVRAIVSADGGDLEVLSAGDDYSSLHLRLVLEGANCEECVLPRPMLESIATDMIQRKVPGFQSVSIVDPRDEPGWVPKEH